MPAARRSRATTLLLAASLATGAVLAWVRHDLILFARAAKERHERRMVTVVVPPGANADDVARILEDAGVVGDARLFGRWLRFVARKAHRLQAGEYELSPGMTPEEIVDILAGGLQTEVRVTIPEGLNKIEVAERLARAGLSSVEAITAEMEDPDTVASFGVPTVGAGGQNGIPGGIEGYLFPDTYRFAKNSPPNQLLWRMRNRLDEVMDGRLTRRMQDRGLDLHAVLTLASLVEKETGAAHERPHIAGVFFNRLRKKMKLQTDPTSVYGVADHDGTISRSDLQRDHPYNTYVIPGLPPGPIAQPGLAAIKAVLWPDTTDDLFFVARGASGEHEFCPTLACHNDAVQRWQRRTDDSGEGSRASTGTANTDAAGGADRTPDDAGEATATRADIAVDQEGPPDAGVIDGGTAPNASSAVTQTPTEGRSPPSQDTSAPSTEHKDIPKRAH